MGVNVYTAAGGPPTTRRSVVAYLDVLGFSGDIRRATASGTADVLLQRFHRVIHDWYSTLRGETLPEPERYWAVKAFTDNVVVGHPFVWGTDGEPEFGAVVSDISLLQIGLAHEGFFVRGGIAAGDLYIDDDIVFGEGLLDAVDAEVTARVPRIVLAQSARDLVKQHLGYYATVAGSPHNRDLFVDEDGQMVLDYLGRSWPDRTEPPMFEWLAGHRDVVVKRLSEHHATPEVLAKYVWTARYHNYSCNRIPACKEYVIDVPVLLPLAAKRLEDVSSVRQVGRASPHRSGGT